MFKEIKNICSPKGELSGSAFIINYLIIFLTVLITNYLGLFLSIQANKYGEILIFKIFAIILLITTIFLLIITTFNYKRRFLNITNNLPIAITLAIIFGILYDLFSMFIFFNPIIFALGKIGFPIVFSIIPPFKADKKEYWQTFFNRIKTSLKTNVAIFVIIMLVLDVILLKCSEVRNNKISKITPNETMENLVINPISAYSGKTKKEILELRKNFVKSSIFATENYKPNENIFGKIQDNRAWWGINDSICYTQLNKSLNRSENSKESRFINNPNILVGVQLSKSYNNQDGKISNFCNDKSLLMIPEKLSYDKEHKLIIATYKSSENFLRNKGKLVHFYMVGLNARDFGYDWIYANNFQNIKFLPRKLEQNTIDKKPRKIKTFIALANNCNIKDGCNNNIAYQPEMEFIFKDFPSEVTLSLWKKKPLFKNQPADFYFKMIFE